MKRAARLQLIAMLIVSGAGVFSSAYPAAIGNATYGIYSDTFEGPVYNSTGVEGVYMGADNGALLGPDMTTYTDGGRSLKVVSPAGKNYAGFWIQFGYDGTYGPPKIPTAMSAYSGGSIDFDIRATSDLSVKIEWASGSRELFMSALRGSNGEALLDGNWHHVSIPLSSFAGIDLTRITVPASFYTKWIDVNPPLRTFWVDNIVWRKSTAGSLDITLRNRSDGQPAAAVTWSGINPATSGWQCADQYMELKFTYFHAGWGIQIYTDNRAADASPRYSGSDDPAGLIGVSTTSLKVPMCWRVVDVSTTSLTIHQGAPGYPNRLWAQELGSGYPCFIWMKDRNSSDFVNALDYATVWDSRGIQHGETTFQGAPSPNYIYFGADFSQAVAPVTYRTGKLTVELFYE